MDSLHEANQALLRAGLHEVEVAFIEPGTRRTLARRLRALEALAEYARHDDGCNGKFPGYACNCGYAEARAALESEVAGGR